jgi:hypothetical protein
MTLTPFQLASTFVILVVIELIGNLDALVVTASEADGEDANKLITSSWLSGIIVRWITSFLFVYTTKWEATVFDHNLAIAEVIIYAWLIKAAWTVFRSSQEDENAETLSFRAKQFALFNLQLALSGENTGAGYAISHNPWMLALTATTSILILWPMTVALKPIVDKNEHWLNPGVAAFIGLIGLTGLYGVWNNIEFGSVSQAIMAVVSLGGCYLAIPKPIEVDSIDEDSTQTLVIPETEKVSIQ